MAGDAFIKTLKWSGQVSQFFDIWSKSTKMEFYLVISDYCRRSTDTRTHIMKFLLLIYLLLLCFFHTSLSRQNPSSFHHRKHRKLFIHHLNCWYRCESHFESCCATMENLREFKTCFKNKYKCSVECQTRRWWMKWYCQIHKFFKSRSTPISLVILTTKI